MSELVLVASCEGAQVRYVAVPTELINVPSEAAVALFSSSFSISKICIYLMRLDLLWVLFSAVLTWLICTEQQTEGFYSTMLRFTLKNFSLSFTRCNSNIQTHLCYQGGGLRASEQP